MPQVRQRRRMVRSAASGFDDDSEYFTAVAMSYALTTILVRDATASSRRCFAVAFSAPSSSRRQSGLVIGLLSMTSLPVDKSTADIWCGYPGVRSVDLGLAVPLRNAGPAASPLSRKSSGSSFRRSASRSGHRVSPARREQPTPGSLHTIVGSRMAPDSLRPGRGPPQQSRTHREAQRAVHGGRG